MFITCNSFQTHSGIITLFTDVGSVATCHKFFFILSYVYTTVLPKKIRVLGTGPGSDLLLFVLFPWWKSFHQCLVVSFNACQQATLVSLCPRVINLLSFESCHLTTKRPQDGITRTDIPFFDVRHMDVNIGCILFLISGV